jgi:hypothetical protein
MLNRSMPTFSYAGRTRDGHRVTAELEAPTKDEAVRMLAAQRITVETITERPSSGGEPPDPDANRVAAEGPRPFRGLLFALAVLAVAFGVGAIAPVAVYECERTAQGAVNCVIHERVWGIVELRTQSLQHVTETSLEERSSTQRDRNTNREYTYDESRIVIHAANEATIRPGSWTSGLIGSSYADIQSAVQTLVNSSAPDRFSRWQVAKTPLYISLGLVLFALAIILLSLLSFSTTFTGWLQRRLADAAQGARAARQSRRH